MSDKELHRINKLGTTWYKGSMSNFYIDGSAYDVQSN
jgi:hypothetical protein